MRPDPFDGISRDAVSRDAAMATSGGERYHNPVKLAAPHWEARPPTRDAMPLPNMLNLTGVTFGRFKVEGLSTESLRQWVCRCSCGDYEIRTARAIRNPNNFGDRCAKCRNMAFEKKEFIRSKTGHESDIRKL